MLDGFIAPSSHARRSIHSLSEHPLVPTFTTPRHCQSRDLILDVFQSCISRARSNPTGLLVSAIASFLSPSKKTPAWVPIAIHSWIRFSTCPSRSLPLSISCFLCLSLAICLCSALFRSVSVDSYRPNSSHPSLWPHVSSFLYSSLSVSNTTIFVPI
jgi:hypothetical protein